MATARAYRMKRPLQKMVTGSSIISEMYFDEWYTWAVHSHLAPMNKLAKWLKKHKADILRCFQTKLINGLLEEINSLVQASKRKARGYRSVENFVAMIYTTVNKLDLIPEQ